MRYLRTTGPSLLKALHPLAAILDGCWWPIGGNAFNLNSEFKERLRSNGFSEDESSKLYWQWLTEYVDRNASAEPVGKPGFFSRLGDVVDFSWTCHFAIEGDTMPLPAIEVVSRADIVWFGSHDEFPPEVIVAAQDIDSAVQEYAFRDEWMFTTIFHHLRHRGYRVEEVDDRPTT